MRCQELGGSSTRRFGATGKLKQEPGSALSPSWSQFTRMDLNPGRVCLEDYKQEGLDGLGSLNSRMRALGAGGSSGRKSRRPRDFLKAL